MKPRPRVRNCEHDHGFPLCACHENLKGWQLLNRSRYLSSLAGWPSPTLDEAFVAEHQATVAAALEAQEAAQEAQQAAQARQSKPRVPLGVNQRSLPPPGCETC